MIIDEIKLLKRLKELDWFEDGDDEDKLKSILEDCSVISTIKSPAEVERVIKKQKEYFVRFKQLHVNHAFPQVMTDTEIIDLIRYLFGLPQDTWKDEDFKDDKTPDKNKVNG